MYTCRSFLLIVEPKCTLAVSHAAPAESRWLCRRDRQTTDRRRTPNHYITLSDMDAVSVIRFWLY